MHSCGLTWTLCWGCWPPSEWGALVWIGVDVVLGLLASQVECIRGMQGMSKIVFISVPIARRPWNHPKANLRPPAKDVLL